MERRLTLPCVGLTVPTEISLSRARRRARRRTGNGIVSASCLHIPFKSGVKLRRGTRGGAKGTRELWKNERGERTGRRFVQGFSLFAIPPPR